MNKPVRAMSFEEKLVYRETRIAELRQRLRDIREAEMKLRYVPKSFEVESRVIADALAHHTYELKRMTGNREAGV